MARFLRTPVSHYLLRRVDIQQLRREEPGRSEASFTHLSAPEASTTTSSTPSDNRSINAPTTLFPWNILRVAASPWTRLEMAAHAQVRSEYSGADNYEAQGISTQA